MPKNLFVITVMKLSYPLERKIILSIFILKFDLRLKLPNIPFIFFYYSLTEKEPRYEQNSLFKTKLAFQMKKIKTNSYTYCKLNRTDSYPIRRSSHLL